jgi:hypothetical protein
MIIKIEIDYRNRFNVKLQQAVISYLVVHLGDEIAQVKMIEEQNTKLQSLCKQAADIYLPNYCK